MNSESIPSITRERLSRVIEGELELEDLNLAEVLCLKEILAEIIAERVYH